MDLFGKIETIANIIKNENDVEKLLATVCVQMLDIFQCDRAWLIYPCDRHAEHWHVPVEHTVPEFPGANSMNIPFETIPDVAQISQPALGSDGPVIYGPGGLAISENTKVFKVKSQISTAIYPRVGKSWQLGLHQCS